MRAELPIEQGKIDRNGINIHYEIYGEGTQTILFIPTWSLVHSRAYKAQIPYFSDRYRVITYDPRGNGESDRPATADGYNLDATVGDVLAVLDKTDTKQAILFGYSYSGLVGAVVAANSPDRVQALITISGNAPIFPTYEYRNSAAFNAEFDSHEGWKKYNRKYWENEYPDFCDFFMHQIFTESHSTKQIEDGIGWASQGDGEMLAMTVDSRTSGSITVDEQMYRRIRCPLLLIHGGDDVVTPPTTSEKVAEVTGGELHIWPGVGHAAHARYPAKANLLVRDFLTRNFGQTPVQESAKKSTVVTRSLHKREKKVLYLSSPIGLGHARRDVAITRELRKLHPGLVVDWLSQDPVTHFLSANNEAIHPSSAKLANESAHIEEESGEHDLNAFQAIRSMDEILIKNFMVFQEVVEHGNYDLVIADEAWDVDHYWHEHPNLKQAQVAWLTDFVGWVPFAENGPREAFLTTDYNAEMIEHVESSPQLRDRAIFVGNSSDIIDKSFGDGLPAICDWVPEHFEFSDYIIGQHPDEFGTRSDLRAEFGYGQDEKVCIATVGGSGVGANLIRRILTAYPFAKKYIPELRLIIVTGPRLDRRAFQIPNGVEAHSFVPNLDRHLAACDLALVQGGLTTCMELAAAGTPFLYFPLKNHFEQNFHVAHRLEQYNAGVKMIYEQSDPDRIAQMMVSELANPRIALPVAANGAEKAAKMLTELLA